MKFYRLLSLFFIFSLALSCSRSTHKENTQSQQQENKDPRLSVGKFTVFDNTKYAFTHGIEELDSSEKISFRLGERLFLTNWVPAPASTTGLDGLGPTFNAKSCTRCHVRRGRGLPIEKSGKESLGFLLRISIPRESENGGPKPVPGYGEQLEDKGILKVNGEADVCCDYEAITGTYPDGTPFELRKPHYYLKNPRYGDLPEDLLLSPRVGNQSIGLGFLDGISEKEILKNEDELDTNKDGISGRANYVWNVRLQKKTIGRFGWKANAPTLEQQIAGAFLQDIGITTPIFPEQNCPDPQTLAQSMPSGDEGGGEVTASGLSDLTFFLTTLSVPARRNTQKKEVQEGEKLFKQLNCIACHRTNILVDNSNVYPKMNGTIINPYSDLLLHDMGEELADHRPDFLASGTEWRTQPLWGIGLIKTVNRHSFLLHDGRARSIEEAILWHGGEANKAKQAFMQLSKKDRKALLQFVQSL